eukprot:6466846-Amphidinium_carterae.1
MIAFTGTCGGYLLWKCDVQSALHSRLSDFTSCLLLDWSRCMAQVPWVQQIFPKTSSSGLRLEFLKPTFGVPQAYVWSSNPEAQRSLFFKLGAQKISSELIL